MKWGKIVALAVGNQLDMLFGVLVKRDGCVVGYRVKLEGEKHMSVSWATQKNLQHR